MALNTGRLKLELTRARVPFIWMLFLILTFVIANVIIFRNLNFERPFENRYKFDVAFDNVKGVFPGQNPVRIAGVEVGVISKQRLENGKGVLTLSLFSQYYPIYKDARLRLRPITPLNDQYVSIDDRGTPAAGIQRPNDRPIAAENTVIPVDIAQVLNTFDVDVRTHMAKLLDEFAIGMAGNGEDLRRAFAEIAPFLHGAQQVSEVMAVRQRAMKRVITNFGDLSDELAIRDRQLNLLLEQGNSTLTTLAQTSGPLSQTIRELPPTMQSIRGSFASLRAAQTDLDPALRSLRPSANNLERGLNALHEFSLDARPTLIDLRRPLTELRPLADDLAPSARSLDNAFSEFRNQTPDFNVITKIFAGCLDEASHFFQDSLSVLKFGNIFGAYPRGNLSQAGNSAFPVVSPLNDLTGPTDNDLTPTRLCTGGVQDRGVD